MVHRLTRPTLVRPCEIIHEIQQHTHVAIKEIWVNYWPECMLAVKLTTNTTTQTKRETH